MEKRRQIEELLQEAIIISKDISVFKSYQLRTALARVYGRFFNSKETRAFIQEQTNAIHNRQKSSQNIIELRPEHFFNKLGEKAEVKHEVLEKKVAPGVNPDKELTKMLVKDLREYFGDIALAVEHINFERSDLGLELIGVKDYKWGEIKNMIKEVTGEKVKREQSGIEEPKDMSAKSATVEGGEEGDGDADDAGEEENIDESKVVEKDDNTRTVEGGEEDQGSEVS